MATVKDILNFIETIAPPYMAESWDNVGLLCGRSDWHVEKILVALDPFASVIDEAIADGADLIVTHHPLIFGEPLKAVNDDTQTGKCILSLLEHHIAAINAHTNLDLAPGGVNDVLANTLDLKNIAVLTPEGTDAQGRPYGLIRTGEVAEQPLTTFLATVKKNLNCDSLRYVSGGRPVRKVCVGGGSCGGAIVEVAAAGCDTLVTADIKYNQFRTAQELGLNLIDAGHFHTENPTMPVLAAAIQRAFPDVQVHLSTLHRDCMRFY